MFPNPTRNSMALKGEAPPPPGIFFGAVQTALHKFGRLEVSWEGRSETLLPPFRTQARGTHPAPDAGIDLDVHAPPTAAGVATPSCFTSALTGTLSASPVGCGK